MGQSRSDSVEHRSFPWSVIRLSHGGFYSLSWVAHVFPDRSLEEHLSAAVHFPENPSGAAIIEALETDCESARDAVRIVVTAAKLSIITYVSRKTPRPLD
jgi:hypothetical protein